MTLSSQDLAVAPLHFDCKLSRSATGWTEGTTGSLALTGGASGVTGEVFAKTADFASGRGDPISRTH